MWYLNHARFMWLVFCIGLFASGHVSAQESTLPKVEILSVDFADKIEGVNGVSWKTKDASKFKGAMVLVRATLPRDTALWSADFSLAYLREGTEDRAVSIGLTAPSSSNDNQSIWLVGEYVKTSVKKGILYFRLLFALENEVTDISLLYKQPVVKSYSISRK